MGDEVNVIDKIFKFEGKDDIRCVIKDDEPWFIAADVCKALDIKDVYRAVSRLEDDERGTTNWGTPGGNQTVLTVSEPGLYTIMLRAHGALTKGTLAYSFRRWVTHEVLPSIRRTGSYTVAERLNADTADLDNRAAYQAMLDEAKAAWRLRQLERYGRTWDNES